MFVSFASFGKGVHQASIALDKVRMDSKAFAKIMKDAGVMCGKLNLARVDLCFTKCYDKVLLSHICCRAASVLHHW